VDANGVITSGGSSGTGGTTGGTGGSGGTGGTTTGGSTSTSTMLNCSMPGDTYTKNPLPKIDGACPGGGTRTVTGGYDSKTGAIDITIKLAACVDAQGNTHDGSAVMQGTLTLTTSTTVANPSTTYDMNETKTIDTTVKFKDGGTMERQCTINRTGTYDDRTGNFIGKVSRNNCNWTGSFKFHPGLVDNLTDNAAAVEPI
jgi:hypothetical protein